MDPKRLFLFLVFSISFLMLWDGWTNSHQPPAPAASAPASAVQGGAVAAAMNAAVTASANTIPQGQTEKPADKRVENQPAGQKITVKTNWLIAEINTLGGDLRHLVFLRQFDASDKSRPFTMLQETGAHTYITQSGLIGNGLPTHNTMFTAEAAEYQLAQGQDKLEVRMKSMDAANARVTKVYTFYRSSYIVDVGYEIENTGNSPLAPSAYFQLVRDKMPPDGDTKFVPTYTGAAVYTEQEKFQKVSFEDVDKAKTGKYPQTADNGWIGMLQHYFVAAWLPEGKTQREFYTKPVGGNLYAVGVVLPVGAIAPGQGGKIRVPLYAGPAQSVLDDIAPGLGLTVDYGWLVIIAKPLFLVLIFLQGWVQNWGVAIILLTLLIKLLFFPLSAASYRSMAKMKVVAPKLERIKQQYGEDKERLHKAMMELYQTEKINPVGGCLPMLIQIPVFIALYWAILSSVELRYAPFFGWIADLSAPDPYYVLPLIMGASMILQSRMNPTPPDPIQAKVMQIMPVVFSIVFFFFPVGLVLYSVVNNVLSILQQWYITKKLNPESKGAARG